MSRSVVKFGGSNLRGPADAARLAAIVKSYGESPVVVVSALFGVTSRLLRALQEAVDDPASPAACRSELADCYLGAACECVEDAAILAECEAEMTIRLDKLFRILSGINLIGDAWPRLHDSVLSFGERLSSLLLASVFRAAGMAASERLPESIGLLTDGRAGSAVVDLGASRRAVMAGLPEGEVCVVPGFYGVTETGEPCILGRGGSDYSAAALAWCLDAESCDLWKDVDGFMSADPQAVEGARALSRLSYAEAAELSYFGAKVLHPQTVDPVERKSIPLRLYNVSSFGGRREVLTEIGPRAEESPSLVKCVTRSDDFAILRLMGPGVGSRPGILGKCAERLADSGINIKSVITSQTCINFLLSRSDLEAAARLLESFDAADIEKVEPLARLSLVAAVGEGMDRHSAVAARMLGSLAAEGIKVGMSAFGASPVAAYCFVSKEDSSRALCTIHREFYGP